ncbi:Soluble guanylyl cyclase alpha-1 subunit [Operophtera brumata]|uniref:Soluble guanylyl cyclase alpha-1 subunit n=1 Tax=Operophtera brumata TaxID=104452 RepID=A0A0L7L1M6_OPEBR|nr:Soluble guanylyl cyclase alpha-1 subunit [Operophtera brumata]
MEYEANFVCTTSHEGKIQLHLTTESEPVAYLLVGYEINAIPLHQKSKEENCEVVSEAVLVASSSKVTDLKIGVASFCKAFPWHFVTDKRLELVQLGILLPSLFLSM